MGLNRNLGQLTEVITEQNGNIGIGGTPNAGFRVDVNGAGRFSGNLTVNSSSSDNGFYQIFGNNSFLNLGADKDGGATLRYNANGNLDITPRNGYNTMFTAGNVGIGTTTDAGFRLDVNGTARATNVVSQGFISAHNVMKTFVAGKSFPERQSNVNYFRISSISAGFQVMVYTMSQNVGVGWTQSQVFQASTAPYWGGWIGSSAPISTIGSSAGFISSAVIGNDGSITFRLSTGDNGTNTGSSVVSYIQVTSFNSNDIIFTQL
jgi:hypothetical protein